MPKYELARNEPSLVYPWHFKLPDADNETKKPLDEIKVLLAGQGSVGKTSLLKRLIGEPFQQYEKKTEGIHIEKQNILAGNKNVQLNLWDFGGQEILHATHQFFMTRRGLYILVTDARQGDQQNRIEYWLKIITSFGGESPIIIVANKIDQHPCKLDERRLRAKYPNIKNFIAASCLDGSGIDELKTSIADVVAAIPHIHDELRSSWFNVKEQLEKMTADYISFADYVRLCRAEGIDNASNQRTLLGLLHDLGVVLNFDERLHQTHILKPKWLTEGVYKILNSPQLFKSKGILIISQLREILDTRIYPRHKWLFIIDMMRKFELCFDFEGYHDLKFLIPELLYVEEPYYKWDHTDGLVFEYHYNILPGSIISRFIVCAKHLIHQKTWWRNGVMLADKSNRALVKADLEEKKIGIWMAGEEKNKKAFLTLIRYYFEHIHGSIAKLEAKGKVPLPDDKKISVDYEHLLKLKELGIEEFLPEGAQRMYQVRMLLESVGKDLRLVQLRQKFTQLESRYRIIGKKIAHLRKAFITETNADERFSLQHSIEQAEEESKKIQSELIMIERQF